MTNTQKVEEKKTTLNKI